MRINELKVHRSMWVPIPTVLLILFIVGLSERGVYSSWISIWEMFLNVSVGMLVGAIVWGPSILICLLMENSMMNASTTKSKLKRLLLLEALIPVLIFNAVLLSLGRGELVGVVQTFFIAMFAQMVRWFYINRKDGLYIMELEEDVQINQMSQES
jgi:membrane protein DedA with SNARE-associated domain